MIQRAYAPARLPNKADKNWIKGKTAVIERNQPIRAKTPPKVYDCILYMFKVLSI